MTQERQRITRVTERGDTRGVRAESHRLSEHDDDEEHARTDHARQQRTGDVAAGVTRLFPEGSRAFEASPRKESADDSTHDAREVLTLEAEAGEVDATGVVVPTLGEYHDAQDRHRQDADAFDDEQRAHDIAELTRRQEGCERESDATAQQPGNVE